MKVKTNKKALFFVIFNTFCTTSEYIVKVYVKITVKCEILTSIFNKQFYFKNRRLINATIHSPNDEPNIPKEQYLR